MSSIRNIGERVKRHTAILIAALVLLQFGAACTVKEALEPLTPTSFVSRPELLRESEKLPFDYGWTSVEVSTWRYGKVVVEAVRTDLVETDSWIYSGSALISSKDSYIEKVNELADYTQKELSEAFVEEAEDDETRDVEVVEAAPEEEAEPVLELMGAEVPEPIEPIDTVEPGDRTLLVQLAFTHVTFGDPLLYGGLLAVPVPALANASTAARAPSISIEARFVDQETGRVIAELVDRRFSQIKIIDVRRLWVGSAERESIDSFVEDLVSTFFAAPGEKVYGRFPLSVLPW